MIIILWQCIASNLQKSTMLPTWIDITSVVQLMTIVTLFYEMYNIWKLFILYYAVVMHLQLFRDFCNNYWTPSVSGWLRTDRPSTTFHLWFNKMVIDCVIFPLYEKALLKYILIYIELLILSNNFNSAVYKLWDTTNNLICDAFSV